MFDIDEFHVMLFRRGVHAVGVSYGHGVGSWLALVDDLKIPKILMIQGLIEVLEHPVAGHVLIVFHYDYGPFSLPM
jgi:hypothetical protein